MGKRLQILVYQSRCSIDLASAEELSRSSSRDMRRSGHGGQGKDGQGKGKPKLKDRAFGKALLKRHLLGSQGMNGMKTGVNDKTNMISILEGNSLDDYVATTEMEDKEVEVRRVHQNDVFLVDPSSAKAIEQNMSMESFDYTHLKIPRKPAWTREMTAADVDRSEKNSFLAWRRDIATMEQAHNELKVTPFEKNIEVWRQLWRVVERSDFLVQIVDARNPLLYYTNDLFKYAKENGKQMMLLVNKADFLTDYQRVVWAKHFDSVNIKFAFYSAQTQQERIDAYDSIHTPEDEKVGIKKGMVPDKVEIELLCRDLFDRWNKDTSSTSSSTNGVFGSTMEKLEEEDRVHRRARVLNREELILLLCLLPAKLGLEAQSRHQNRVCIGMVGYPNVGKSSVINTILGVSKSSHGVLRVAVSSTPGKTKHFQTLNVSDSLMLCDCPGLVFPSFMASTGEMLCSGILPINQMRDYADPSSVIASRVPMHLLDAAYGMKIRRELDFMDNVDRPPTGSEMLCAYCAVKGFITNGTGRWDEFRACKLILRDFNDGVILFVAPPKDYSNMDRWFQETEKTMVRREKVAERIALQRLREAEEEERDALLGKSSGTRKAGSKRASAADGALGDNMVFGDGSYEDNDDDDDDNDNDDNGGDGDGGGGSSVGDGKREDKCLSDLASELSDAFIGGFQVGDGEATKREHKRLKHWGKKNRKLRDKNPYGEDNGVVSYVAYSTNRSKSGGAKREVTRHSTSVPYGHAFTRETLHYNSQRQSAAGDS